MIAIGDALLGRASSGVKTFAVQSFGESYKLILVAAIYAVIAVLAMAIGLLARRRLAGGVTGMAALGAFGAFVALTRPESHATDVIPSLIGGAAGVAALVLLVRAGSPQVILAAAAQRARGGYRRGAEPEVVGTNRRNFLLAGVTAAGAAVAAGVAGKVLGKQQAISARRLRQRGHDPRPAGEGAPAAARGRAHRAGDVALLHAERQLLPRRHRPRRARSSPRPTGNCESTAWWTRRSRSTSTT